MIEKKVGPGAEYLNVDLEVRSRSNLNPLAEALSERLFVLYAGRIPGGFLASFETHGSLPPDIAITRLAAALTGLRPDVRKLWTEARDRVFDIGLEKVAGRGVVALALRRETVQTLAALNARVAFTLYPHSPAHLRKAPNQALQRTRQPRRAAERRS